MKVELWDENIGTNFIAKRVHNREWLIFTYSFYSYFKTENLKLSAEPFEINEIDPLILFHSKYFDDYVSRRIESQGGFLHGFGKTKKSKSPNFIGKWRLNASDYSRNEFILGTSVPHSYGVMDEKRIYRYDCVDKYIKMKVT